jgi:hypothetical protein
MLHTRRHMQQLQERSGGILPCFLRNVAVLRVGSAVLRSSSSSCAAVAADLATGVDFKPSPSICAVACTCRDLFIELHFGPRRYVDPEPFANSLQLNHAIQQVCALRQHGSIDCSSEQSCRKQHVAQALVSDLKCSCMQQDTATACWSYGCLCESSGLQQQW